MLDSDRILGTLLGTAVGDALGMPIDGLSHQNVRTYYKGIKGYRADEHRRDLDAGQWTALTQRTFALAHSLPESDGKDAACCVSTPALRRRQETSTPTATAAASAAPLGVWWAVNGVGDEEALFVTSALGEEGAARAAAYGQAFAIRTLLTADADSLDGAAWFAGVTEAAAWAEAQLDSGTAVSDRLRLLAGHLDDFPLDLQDLCDGTGPAADEAWPFAVAIVARNPTLLEATLLPAINVGGAASAIGACVGALLGALHGWAAFPAWAREGLEEVARLEAEARAFADALMNER